MNVVFTESIRAIDKEQVAKMFYIIKKVNIDNTELLFDNPN